MIRAERLSSERCGIIRPGLARRGVLLGATALLCACGSIGNPVNPANPQLAPISFSGEAIPFATQRVEVTVRPRPLADPSPADADFVVSPEQVARQWARYRLRAAGGQYGLRYIIDDASAISRTDREGETIVGTIQVRLIVTTPYGVEEAGIGAQASSEIRIDGSPSLIERQEALHRISLDLAKGLDERLSRSIPQSLGRYIVRGR